MEFEEKNIECQDCGGTFVHSAEDQARYAERGFTNDPKRCRECRDKRKSQQQSRGGGGDNDVREATAEEIEHGHAHGEGGHAH